MYKRITSTILKQDTRKVLNSVASSINPTIIYTYNEPKVVMMSYENWRKMRQPQPTKTKTKQRLSLLDKARDFIIDGPKIDSTKIIRRLRDSE